MTYFMLNFALDFHLFHAELFAIWCHRFQYLRDCQFNSDSTQIHCPLAAPYRLRDQSIVKCFVQVSEINKYVKVVFTAVCLVLKQSCEAHNIDISHMK